MIAMSTQREARTILNLVPGRYIRRWAGYDVEVEIRIEGGNMVEISPGEWSHNPATMPDAEWFPIEEAE